MPTYDEINELVSDLGETVLLADGFEDALLGFAEPMNSPMVAVYDWRKMMDILMNRDGMSYDDAYEYLEFNVLGAWVGERTPIYVKPLSEYI